MHKTKSGFTVVELLIVIVIIAILAAITVVADAMDVGSGGLPYCVPGTATDADSDGVGDCTEGYTKGAAKSSADTLFANAKISGLKFPDTVLTNSNGTKAYGIQITYNSAGFGVDGIHRRISYTLLSKDLIRTVQVATVLAPSRATIR